MIKPFLQDDALLADIRRAAADLESFHLWWLGQSGFLLQWQGRHLLLDPYLSDSLTKKYANTDRPHVRLTERVIDPARLDFIDAVTSSHNHTDHLDAETLIPLIDANSEITFVIPEANRSFVAERLKIDAAMPVGINAGETIEIKNFKITGMPAAHEELERDEQGRCKFMGFVIQCGPWTIYHSGDTIWHDEIVARLKGFSIDVALLPINGRKGDPRIAGNLNPQEAVALARQISARLVIPCHYDMFAFNTADPQEFARAAEAQGQRYRVLKCGERCSSSELKSD